MALRIAPVAGGRGLQAELDRIRADEAERGFTDGRLDGYAAGYTEGESQGRARGEAQAAAEAARRRDEEVERLSDDLARLRSDLATAWDEFVENARIELADRAMEATRAVLAHELTLSREGAVAIVRRCLEEVPHGDRLRVRVSVADRPEIERRLAEIDASLAGRGVEFVADEAISAGCIIESAAGRVDGRVETALELIENDLGRAA